MTVDFRHNLIYAFKDRIHMSCVEKGFFLGFFQLVGIDHIPNRIEMGSLCPMSFNVLRIKAAFCFVSRR